MPTKEIFNFSTLIQRAPESERDGVVRQFFFDADRTMMSLGYKRDGTPTFSGREFKITYLDGGSRVVYLTFDGSANLSAFFQGRVKSWNKPTVFDKEIGDWIDVIAKG
jgi:hypothetical protein